MPGVSFTLASPPRMSDFHEVLFPVDISYGSSGGPKLKTSVWTSDSGFEARVIDWNATRGEYDVSHGIKTHAQMQALTAFFMNRRGRAYGFRFKDWNDYIAEDVFLGYGDYATRNYQIVKNYKSPAHDGVEHTFDRPLKKIAWGTENGITIDGELITRIDNGINSYAIDYNTGILRLSAPMRGGWYHGIIPVTPIDYLSAAEGSRVVNYANPTLVSGGVMYDMTAGIGYQNAYFSTPGADTGIRAISIETAEEVAQADVDQMGLPVTGEEPWANNGLSGIICVGADGYLYLNVGGTSNGVAVMKVDGTTLQYVTHWGQVHPFGPNEVSSDYPSAPGCVSLDNKTFVHFGLFGSIDLHSTETCQRLRELLVTGGITSHGHVGACPYRNTGFGILYNHPTDNYEGECALYIYLGGGIGYEAMVWGGPGGRVRSGFYDLKTGGILLFWEGEDGDPNDQLDSWCGLYHEDNGGFRWKRRMPRQLFHSGLGHGNMQVPLNGDYCWACWTPFFGWCWWTINTEDGELRARRSPSDLGETPGEMQVYDPTRKLIMAHGGADMVINCDVQGVPMDPPQELRLGYVEFHVGVRFDTDHLNVQHEFWTHKTWQSIPLVEVRNWADVDLD